MKLHFFLVFLSISFASCRILFFGVTQSGKTSLINSCCGLRLPVAIDGAFTSTTKDITTHECLGNYVVDTVGIFDYRPEEKDRFDVKDVLKMILENAKSEGLSGILWVWGSKQTVGNHELEEIFKTLRSLLPEVLPMAIVNNQFPGLNSQVPSMLSQKFEIELISADLNNVETLKDWIKKHTENIRIQLPPNWQDYLVKHNINQLREELLKTSLMSCDTVQQQLKILSDKIASTQQPKEECHCAQDCRRERKYCCQRVIGICVSKCTDSWIDATCQSQVKECYEICKKAHGDMIAKTNELLASLNQEYQHINSLNVDLLRTCDKFRLSQKVQKAEL